MESEEVDVGKVLEKLLFTFLDIYHTKHPNLHVYGRYLESSNALECMSEFASGYVPEEFRKHFLDSKRNYNFGEEGFYMDAAEENVPVLEKAIKSISKVKSDLIIPDREKQYILTEDFEFTPSVNTTKGTVFKIVKHGENFENKSELEVNNEIVKYDPIGKLYIPCKPYKDNEDEN